MPVVTMNACQRRDLTSFCFISSPPAAVICLHYLPLLLSLPDFYYISGNTPAFNAVYNEVAT